jgi:hypothetical protein
MPKKFIKRLGLRFVGEHDEKIYNQLVDSADKNHRSLNGEIVDILDEHFSKKQKQEPKQETK